MNEEETQYKVTWFPDDAPQRSMVTASRDRALSRFTEVEARGYAPILEKRVLTYSEWETL